MKDQTKTPENQPKTSEDQAQRKPQVAKTIALPKPAEKSEVEKLREELANLKSQLSETPMSLEEKIKFYQAKQENISKLTRLDGFAASLVTLGEEVQNSMGENEFTSDKYSFQVIKKNYSHHEGNKILDINNPVLVAEVLDFALGKINVKRQQLQTLIEA